MSLIICFSVAIFLIWLKNSDEKHFMAIIDAGSSGSRVHIYKYTYNDKARDGKYASKAVEPDHATLKETPGLSTFDSHPADAGARLEPLVAFAKQHIPSYKIATTPILLKATAGLRLVQQQNPDAVESIIQSVRNTLSKSGFRFVDSNAMIISGQEEGMLGWLALNYLIAAKKNLRGGTSTMWGLIEMGGASVQVSVPKESSTDVPSNFVLDYTSPLSGQKGKMYTHSFLGLGGESAQKAVEEKLFAEAEENEGTIDVCHPCLPKEFTESIQAANGQATTISGTGDYEACKNLIDKTLFTPEDSKVEECKKTASHCLWNGIASPVLTQVQKLWAFETFFYVMSGIGEMSPDEGAKEFKVKDYERVAKNICGKDFPDVDANYPKDTQPKSYNKVWCFSATYAHRFLTKGLELEDDKSVMIGNSVENVSIDWALGAVLQHHPVDI
jgi:Golgi nucleoside diphosphatase